MYLSRIDLLPAAASRPAIRSRLGNSYGLHQVLWDLFSDSPDRQRDFLFRQEDLSQPAADSPLLRTFTLSEREPVDRLGNFFIETRVLDPVFGTGDRLGFSVRVNPTIRHHEDARKNKARHDVVMDAKRQWNGDGPQPSSQELVQSATLGWLRRQAERGGFDFAEGEVTADGYRQHRFRKNGKNEVRLSTVDLEGVLTILDPDRFRALWQQGLGPAKGFGCGLLLLRRA